jgi:hypothetical protein
MPKTLTATATAMLNDLETDLAAVKAEIGTTDDPWDLADRLDEIKWQLERLKEGLDDG